MGELRGVMPPPAPQDEWKPGMGTKSDVYKPNAAVLRAEETSRIAFASIAADTAARHEKSRRLREARLMRDEGHAPGTPPATTRGPRKKWSD